MACEDAKGGGETFRKFVMDRYGSPYALDTNVYPYGLEFKCPPDAVPSRKIRETIDDIVACIDEAEASLAAAEREFLVSRGWEFRVDADAEKMSWVLPAKYSGGENVQRDSRQAAFTLAITAESAEIARAKKVLERAETSVKPE